MHSCMILEEPEASFIAQGDRSHHQIGMTGEIFRNCRDRNIDAEIEWFATKRRCIGIVGCRWYAMFPASRYDTGTVLDLQCPPAGRFQPTQRYTQYQQIHTSPSHQR